MLTFDHLSYWEQKEYLKNVDYCIIGSGIVGLTSAIFLKKHQPKANILILERGYLPSGASTKNAGFVCYGSPSEILDDLNHSSEAKVIETIQMRYSGFQILSSLLSLKKMNYKQEGSYELFRKNDPLFEDCINQLDKLNHLFKTVTNTKSAFKLLSPNKFKHQFTSFSDAIICELEGSIDTGKMMNALILLAQKKGIKILNGIQVKSINDNTVVSNYGEICFSKCIVATNAFTSSLLPNKYVEPARAQVVITSPIEDLKIKGTFHFDKGYYYFRNIDKRILFGGGRNINFNSEKTEKIENTVEITNHLTEILKNDILSKTDFDIEYSWSGIMGIGEDKSPIMEFATENIFLAAKLGGMGVAMGALVGKNAATKIIQS